MANNYGTQPVTGKSSRKQVPHMSTAMQAGLVQAAHFADAKDVVNDTTKSGKQLGALLVTSGTHKPYIAIGSQPTDAWHTLSVGTAVTPA